MAGADEGRRLGPWWWVSPGSACAVKLPCTLTPTDSSRARDRCSSWYRVLHKNTQGQNRPA